LQRGDEDFRLAVDRALSTLYASGDIANVYAKSFGPPSDAVRTFFLWNTMIQ
jgi:polar amino acid transport system substrate-binding protein